ncbi:hypothetical protein NWP22_17510 [Anabaenopsis tanganyikae CS-531]|uniref:PylC N-terminal domain-containing protein n=2 Tax=Anabaenopsis TaxID=110103 RepID=A0ABT5AQ63_9CYAN|nr:MULTISPECIES: hypothetical protein [Anabaenopsis]MDB9538490.1 hypothetical protein [Anabaenopsis arnoldii]MDH6090763.1 hypothetical protein [Anabaenopsis arnoldii]MDH6107632.1 hypothetical protein [Anabaenopsis tanganyikae CS-531]
MVKNLLNTKILITGACGVTSRSVVRSLKKSSIFNNVRIIGTDICENPYGLYEGLYDRIYRVPFCSNPEYHNIMTSICAEEKIDAAIIIPELEVLYWCKNQIPVKTLLPPPLFQRNVFCH